LGFLYLLTADTLIVRHLYYSRYCRGIVIFNSDLCLYYFL